MRSETALGRVAIFAARRGRRFYGRLILSPKGLACKAPVADLMRVDLARLPSKRNGAEVGARNDALNKGVFLATRNGEPIEPHVAAARAAGLQEPEIADHGGQRNGGGRAKGRRANTSFTDARTPDAAWPPV